MPGNIGASLIGRAQAMMHRWGVGQKHRTIMADEKPFSEWKKQAPAGDERPARKRRLRRKR